MTRTIVCFGDSNTHGADPAGGPRLAADVRWTGVLATKLGTDYRVIEEGLSGRTTVWQSPLAPYHDGSAYLMPCLLSHAPIDLVTIMLGTNDLKRAYRVGAPEIATAAGVLVGQARRSLTGVDGAPPRVLLMAPVPLGPATERMEIWGFGEAVDESRRLAPMYRVVAEESGVAFFDAGSVASVSTDDGVHLDAAAHAALGGALATAVRGALGSP
jgi:lysophospholipase L1-like esterase